MDGGGASWECEKIMVSLKRMRACTDYAPTPNQNRKIFVEHVQLLDLPDPTRQRTRLVQLGHLMTLVWDPSWDITLESILLPFCP